MILHFRPLATFLVMVLLAQPLHAATSSETLRLLDLFSNVFDRVKSDYVEEVGDKKLIESAIQGMLSSLDPHSSYLNEKDFDEMNIHTKGKFGGLGIEVTMEDGLVKVVAPIDDTPAAHAGILTGDYISKIDGESVMGLSLNEAVDRMRGDPGTKIKLQVLREGESEPLEIVIKRAIIKIESVSYRREEDIAYIRVKSFSEHVAKNIRKHIKNANNDIGVQNLKGLVLDLRTNPGGLLDQAIEVSDLFLEKGEIVSTKGRISDSNKRFNARKGDIMQGKPIIVLINGGSASASEIVAGALQDHDRALILGTKSFGKGSVQTVIPLSASGGAMRLTTSRYYTPSGRSIQAEGISPDIEVEQAKIETVKTGQRTSEASLRKHLENTDKKDDDGKKDTQKKSNGELYKKDYQLARALDLLRGISIYHEQ